LEKIESFIQELAELNKDFERFNQETVKQFDNFGLLDLSIKEDVHLRMLATLLNPNGKHSKGDSFLQLFLKIVNIPKDKFYLDDVNLKIEKEDGISLFNGKQQKIVVSKLFMAGTLQEQLNGYREHPGRDVFSVSLYGEGGAEDDTFPGAHLIQPESYLQWLKFCRRAAEGNPLLYTMLKHYIVFFKKLTDHEMEEEWVETITRKENYLKVIFTLAGRVDVIKFVVFKERFVPLMQDIADKKNLVLSSHLDYFMDGSWWFYFYHHSWKKLALWFTYDKELIGLRYGFDKTGIPALDDYLSKTNFRDKNFEQRLYYLNDNFYLKLYSNPDEIIKIFEDRVDKHLKLLEDSGVDSSLF